MPMPPLRARRPVVRSVARELVPLPPRRGAPALAAGSGTSRRIETGSEHEHRISRNELEISSPSLVKPLKPSIRDLSGAAFHVRCEVGLREASRFLVLGDDEDSLEKRDHRFVLTEPIEERRRGHALGRLEVVIPGKLAGASQNPRAVSSPLGLSLLRHVIPRQVGEVLARRCPELRVVRQLFQAAIDDLSGLAIILGLGFCACRVSSVSAK